MYWRNLSDIQVNYTGNQQRDMAKTCRFKSIIFYLNEFNFFVVILYLRCRYNAIIFKILQIWKEITNPLVVSFLHVSSPSQIIFILNIRRSVCLCLSASLSLSLSLSYNRCYTCWETIQIVTLIALTRTSLPSNLRQVVNCSLSVDFILFTFLFVNTEHLLTRPKKSRDQEVVSIDWYKYLLIQQARSIVF